MSENNKDKPSRRQQILEALAHELEKSPGQRITTAGLARAVGVSEAALYRHFPSKAKMFEGLIEFIEESVFGLINRILKDESRAVARSEKIMLLLLGFSARNPGISRILVGDALIGETERLHQRISQFFDRIESQLKQILREAELAGELRGRQHVAATANMLLAAAEGRMNQYVRSNFKRSPMVEWEEQWALLAAAIFH
ncbi:MAG: nucleoid occlusion factor SlmA [Gammaproteobacteria bacterium]|nr:nucleoid occlusion factor SlmA [Gammaproteobacteria bacterium]MCW8840574.1 nucleoid occlusion factor SlmA [Gammaproteobacteria bacterium]MCW8927545.1 nucleoid occlusion factor SlmA [Gammaproteobacteria bacterium]MCW8958885.1 nucleoid occlusion factor SlmA [Gammaproteobacteria bacterium]MCW8973328.1 nucleoid occlusion factor SlmA [Gammaproteobacteria bacterium]